MFYLFIAIFSAFFASLSERISFKTAGYSCRSLTVEKIFLFISFLFLFVPAAIRYGIGQDYFYTYHPLFGYIIRNEESIYTGDLIGYNEIGFNYLNKIIGCFTNDPQWLFVVTSFICLYVAYKCIYDYSPNRCFSAFFLVLGSYYLGSYSLVRQSIAIVIFLYAIRYVVLRHPLKYFGLISLAITIHSASIIYIPFYFIGNIQWKKEKYIKILLMLFCVLNVSYPVVKKIVSLTRFANRINGNGQIHIILSLVVIAVFLFALWGYREECDDSLYRVFLNVHFVSVCLIGLSKYLDTIDRIIWSYYYINFISIPY